MDILDETERKHSKILFIELQQEQQSRPKYQNPIQTTKSSHLFYKDMMPPYIRYILPMMILLQRYHHPQIHTTQYIHILYSFILPTPSTSTNLNFQSTQNLIQHYNNHLNILISSSSARKNQSIQIHGLRKKQKMTTKSKNNQQKPTKIAQNQIHDENSFKYDQCLVQQKYQNSMSSKTQSSTLIQQAQILKKAYLQTPHQHQNSQQFQKMIAIVKKLTLSDFVIPQEFPLIPTEGVVHKQFGLRISLFFLPKGTKTLLHDHPNMYVINKVLKGSFKKSQYSLQNSQFQQKIPQNYLGCMNPTDSFAFPVVKSTKIVETINMDHVDIITPEDNLHRFQTEEDSIFIDIIAPDYDGVQIFYNTYQQQEQIEEGKVTLQMGPPKLQENYMIRIEME